MGGGSWLKDVWVDSRDASWKALDAEFSEDYMNRLSMFLCCESTYGRGFYPAKAGIFKAFALTSLDQVKVVILGQDPYYDGKATGLAFAVAEGTPRDSLGTIFKAVKQQRGVVHTRNDLLCWASQGVLLLNTVLTVAQGHARSHRGCRWEEFTRRAVDLIDTTREGVVFLLWGDDAAGMAEWVNAKRHRLLPPAAHPSARGKTRLPKLIDSGHFSEANRLLQQAGRDPICW